MTNEPVPWTFVDVEKGKTMTAYRTPTGFTPAEYVPAPPPPEPVPNSGIGGLLTNGPTPGPPRSLPLVELSSGIPMRVLDPATQRPMTHEQLKRRNANLAARFRPMTPEEAAHHEEVLKHPPLP